MTGSRQREWMADVLEGLPSIVFLALWRGEMVDPAAAGWTGSALAAAVLIGFSLRRVAFNPVLLGINLHLLVITPLIVGLFRAGQPELARTLLDTAQAGVLVAVFLVGGALTAFAARGFIGVDGLPAATRRRYSLLLLAVAAAAVPWSVANAGSTLLAVGVPLIALFGLRRYLIARWRDRADGNSTGNRGGEALAVAGAPSSD